MNSFKLMMVKEPGVTYPEVETSNSASAARCIAKYLQGFDRECLVEILVDTQNVVIGISTIAIGPLDSVLCHPREFFKIAILGNAKSVIVGHNHPSSGNPNPSVSDRELFEKLKNAGDLLGIDVLDSIIVGEGKYYSLCTGGKSLNYE